MKPGLPITGRVETWQQQGQWHLNLVLPNWVASAISRTLSDQGELVCAGTGGNLDSDTSHLSLIVRPKTQAVQPVQEDACNATAAEPEASSDSKGIGKIRFESMYRIADQNASAFYERSKRLQEEVDAVQQEKDVLSKRCKALQQEVDFRAREYRHLNNRYQLLRLGEDFWRHDLARSNARIKLLEAEIALLKESQQEREKPEPEGVGINGR